MKTALCIVVICLSTLCYAVVGNRQKSVVINLSIPWPSGIQVDKVTDNAGNQYRFGRLQQNVISLRPQWSVVNLVGNVFNNSECNNIIERAEEYAKAFGWSKGRHIDYSVRPTKDLPVDVIYDNEEDLQFIYKRFEAKIWPALAKEYNLDSNLLRPSDLFITKYDASTHENLLGPHKDKSPWSFVIPLNGDFSGGGTYFFDSQVMWKPPVGSALYFSGNQLHGGSPITSGVRYILAGFCDYGDDPLQSFLDAYDPLYDGYAARAGFRTGDMIVGLEVCVESEERDDSNKANSTTLNINEATEINTVGDIGSGDIQSVTTSSAHTTGFTRRMQEVTGDTSDEEWIAMAQSCERLDPGAHTVMRVRRRVSVSVDDEIEEVAREL